MVLKPLICSVCVVRHRHLLLVSCMNSEHFVLNMNTPNHAMVQRFKDHKRYVVSGILYSLIFDKINCILMRFIL